MDAKRKEEVRAMLDRIDANQRAGMLEKAKVEKKMSVVGKDGLNYIKVFEKDSGESALGPERNVMRWIANMRFDGFHNFSFICISKEEEEDILEGRLIFNE